MSLVTGLARLPGRLCCLFIWELSAWSTGMKLTEKIKIVKHKLVSFTIVVALWTLVTLLIKLICILLKWKYIDCKKYAVLAAMMRKRSYFVKKVSFRSPGLECSYGKISSRLPRSRSQKPRSR